MEKVMSFAKPLVSIGMPVYNSERFLTEALDSLVAQTFTDFELVISDNASTDGTEEICRACAARDRRIRYMRNEMNVGVYRNFNRVFQASSGEYFKWASADDVCHRDLIVRCLEVLDRDPTVVLVYPKTIFIDETGSPLGWKDPGWDLQSDAAHERMRYVIYAGHWVNTFYGLIRADVLKKTRLFPSYNSGDYRLIGELSLHGKFVETHEYLFSRRIHRGASSQNPAVEWQTKYTTGRSGPPGLPSWHLCFDHLITVLRSQLRFKQKLSLGSAVTHRMYLKRRELLGELMIATKGYTKNWFRRQTTPAEG